MTHITKERFVILAYMYDIVLITMHDNVLIIMYDNVLVTLWYDQYPLSVFFMILV